MNPTNPITRFFKSPTVNNPTVIAAATIGLALLIIGLFGVYVAGSIANKGNSLSVTGSAERIVTSDTAKWNISLRERSQNPNANIAQVLASRVETVKAYLLKAGVKAEEITIDPPQTNDLCAHSPNGYSDCNFGVIGREGFQTVRVETNDVKKIAALANTITAELAQVNISNQNVEYYYNGLKDLRITLLNEATANARARAAEIAKSSGASLGALVSASTGVFQVTAKNSVDVTDYGTYDTSTVEKKVTAIVRTAFRIRN